MEPSHPYIIPKHIFRIRNSPAGMQIKLCRVHLLPLQNTEKKHETNMTSISSSAPPQKIPDACGCPGACSEEQGQMLPNSAEAARLAAEILGEVLQLSHGSTCSKSHTPPFPQITSQGPCFCGAKSRERGAREIHMRILSVSAFCRPLSHSLGSKNLFSNTFQSCLQAHIGRAFPRTQL